MSLGFDATSYLGGFWGGMKDRVLKWATGVAAMGVGVTVLYRFDPATSTLFPACPFHSLTGLHCPGCGTTRALHQLLHGHFLEALDLNALFVLSLPVLGFALLTLAISTARGDARPGVLRNPVWTRLALGILLAFWVLRNLPFTPFSWLAP